MERLLLFLTLGMFFSCNEKKIAEESVVSNQKYNVLFISVDDLRPQLGAYGNTTVHSPNIDKLAAQATVFNKAYCQVPVCGASRASILTGLLPTAERFLRYDTRTDEDAPGTLLLPKHFKNNGYYTLNYGKVGHFPDDQEDSWSEDAVRIDWTKMEDGTWSTEGWRDYVTAKNLGIAKRHPQGAGLSYESAAVHDTAYVDGKNIKKAMQKLGELKKMDRPFFFAVGLLKPHLPFNAPKKYWDLYEEEDLELAKNPLPPKDVPKAGLNNYPELRAYAGVPQQGPIPDSLATKLVHGYHASVSYVDALIGNLMDRMEELDLMKNTIIVLWSDHGWFLGEHGYWCKHALYELGTRVPLIIKVPGMKEAKRVKTFVELVDLYPTLCDLTNLAKPDHLQGKSFAPVFSDADYEHKKFAYSRFRTGESVKIDSLRYSVYLEEGKMTGEMLYDHNKDPDENINIVGDSKYRKEKKRLSGIINGILE